MRQKCLRERPGLIRTRASAGMCRPSGTRLIHFPYPALPCRAIGCVVPPGLASCALYDTALPFSCTLEIAISISPEFI
jgi:hypothetical protein